QPCRALFREERSENGGLILRRPPKMRLSRKKNIFFSRPAVAAVQWNAREFLSMGRSRSRASDPRSAGRAQDGSTGNSRGRDQDQTTGASHRGRRQRGAARVLGRRFASASAA